jgi:hypothetical protein
MTLKHTTNSQKFLYGVMTNTASLAYLDRNHLTLRTIKTTFKYQEHVVLIF